MPMAISALLASYFDESLEGREVVVRTYNPPLSDGRKKIPDPLFRSCKDLCDLAFNFVLIIHC
eukprot:4570842-Ditylum_brightwellii.AAC.1